VRQILELLSASRSFLPEEETTRMYAFLLTDTEFPAFRGWLFSELFWDRTERSLLRESLDLRVDLAGWGREQGGCGVSGRREGMSGLVDSFWSLFLILFLYIDFNNKSYHVWVGRMAPECPVNL
jgi:hypothetical protein